MLTTFYLATLFTCPSLTLTMLKQLAGIWKFGHHDSSFKFPNGHYEPVRYIKLLGSYFWGKFLKFWPDYIIFNFKKLLLFLIFLNVGSVYNSNLLFVKPTTTGAIVSICCVVFISFMLVVELLWFIAPDIKSELIVENADPTER